MDLQEDVLASVLTYGLLGRVMAQRTGHTLMGSPETSHTIMHTQAALGPGTRRDTLRAGGMIVAIRIRVVASTGYPPRPLPFLADRCTWRAKS